MDQALTAPRVRDLKPETARRWLDEWNRQQEGYVRFRDCRFEIIADALTASGLVAPVILDLGCGPGSLGDRLAARLPGAEIVGDATEDFADAYAIYQLVKGTPDEVQMRALMPARFDLLDRMYG